MSAVFIMVAKTISTTQCNYWEEYGQAGFTRMAGWMRWWYTREWSFTSVLTWLDVEQIRWHLLALNSNYSWMMAGFFTVVWCLQCFRDAISCAVMYKNNPTDFTDLIMKELEVYCVISFNVCLFYTKQKQIKIYIAPNSLIKRDRGAGWSARW